MKNTKIAKPVKWTLAKVKAFLKQRSAKDLDEAQKKSLVCTLVGHSKIITAFFGYQYCGRCGEQVGDSLGGVGRSDVVIIGHNCPECQANYKPLKWQSKFMVPNPFKEEKAS